MSSLISSYIPIFFLTVDLDHNSAQIITNLLNLFFLMVMAQASISKLSEHSKILIFIFNVLNLCLFILLVINDSLLHKVMLHITFNIRLFQHCKCQLYRYMFFLGVFLEPYSLVNQHKFSLTNHYKICERDQNLLF